MRAAYEIGVEDVNEIFNGSVRFTVEYATDALASNCLNVADIAEWKAAEWYYRQQRMGKYIVPVISTTGLAVDDMISLILTTAI